MAKLYPPYINGTIPAFYHSEGTIEIVVPFTMNRGVAPADVAGFALKIKTINGDVKGVVQIGNKDMTITTGASVTFPISNIEFLIGQYYKVQLAYVDKAGVIGYYSTVGITKCTTKPEIYIEGLTFGQANVHNYSYVGVYSQFGGDVTEKMYSYQFVLTDSEGNIIADSGERLHNTSFDNISYESHEEFLISQDLDLHKSYYIQFRVTTTNKLVVHSVKYRIAQRRSISPDVDANLIAGRNFNNGYILLTIYDDRDPVISGTFLISRASSKNGFNWEEIKRFDLHSLPPEDWSYRDYTVEQGVTYMYSLQQYNAQGVYSDRIISNSIVMDFEDMFLYDGERQLRIRYNPKVSTFKTDILESKVDTIGSQFPFISRNGNVNYKEFAISGLISYLSDEAENFIEMSELGLDGYSNIRSPYGRYATTNLVDYNIMAERIFKNKVLDWLNNGQVKLFKSPAEGNFLVRLMNVSLSPTDSLSRMLHTFTASAFEVAEFNSSNLAYYNLIDPRENLETLTRWVTVDLYSKVQDYLTTNDIPLEEAIGDTIELITRDAIYVDFRDIIPGAHVKLGNEDIQIGATGAYHFETTNSKNSIKSIRYVIDSVNEGQLTYGYLAQAVTIFGLINDIELLDSPVEQFIGRNYLNDAHTWSNSLHTYVPSTNLFDALNNIRTTVLNVVFLRAEKRPIDTIYMYNSFSTVDERDAFLRGEITDLSNYQFYTDMYCETPFSLDTADKLALYRIRFRANTTPFNRLKNYKYYVDANLDDFAQLTDICIDGSNGKVVIYSKDIFDLTINAETINLDEIEKYYIKNKSVKMYNIEFNDGVIVEVSCSKQIKVYNVETNYHKYPTLYQARLQYFSDQSNMINTRQAAHYDTSIIKASYNNYILELNKALDQYREENGLVE